MRIESDDFGGMFDVVWICCRVVEAFRNWQPKVLYRDSPFATCLHLAGSHLNNSSSFDLSQYDDTGRNNVIELE